MRLSRYFLTNYSRGTPGLKTLGHPVEKQDKHTTLHKHIWMHKLF